MLKWIQLGVVASLLVVPALSQAQRSQQDDKPHPPRPEAIAACKDKSEGDVCGFETPKGHIDGTCHKSHDGELACHHPHHHPDGGAH
jgi:hypothetical protein